jgi:hypothetical protein
VAMLLMLLHDLPRTAGLNYPLPRNHSLASIAYAMPPVLGSPVIGISAGLQMQLDPVQDPWLTDFQVGDTGS